MVLTSPQIESSLALIGYFNVSLINFANASYPPGNSGSCSTHEKGNTSPFSFNALYERSSQLPVSIFL